MAESKTKVQAARATSLTQEDAARVIGCSTPTMARKERNPDKMSLGEFFKLYDALGADGRSIMWSYIEDRRNFFTDD